MAVGDLIMKGRDLRVSIDGKEIAYESDCTITLTPVYIEYSNKDLPKNFKVLDYVDWNISGNSLTVWAEAVQLAEGADGSALGDRFGTIDMIDGVLADLEVDVKVAIRKAVTPNTTGEQIETSGDIYYGGKAKFGDVSLNPTSEGDASGSFTMNRNGDLSKMTVTP